MILRHLLLQRSLIFIQGCLQHPKISVTHNPSKILFGHETGSRVSRPGASFRRPESEPRPPHPDPSCADAVASLAAVALSNRPCLPLLHASRSPHLSCPDAVARRSLALTAITRPRSAPAPAHQSIRPTPASTARSTPPSAAKLARSWPETSPTPGSLPCL